MRKVTVLYFYDEITGPCMIQTSLVESVQSRFKRGVEFKRINIEKDKELVERYSVDDIPTIVIECDGKERERFVGLTQELFLRRAIQRALKECK